MQLDNLDWQDHREALEELDLLELLDYLDLRAILDQLDSLEDLVDLDLKDLLVQLDSLVDLDQEVHREQPVRSSTFVLAHFHLLWHFTRHFICVLVSSTSQAYTRKWCTTV